MVKMQANPQPTKESVVSENLAAGMELTMTAMATVPVAVNPRWITMTEQVPDMETTDPPPIPPTQLMVNPTAMFI